MKLIRQSQFSTVSSLYNFKIHPALKISDYRSVHFYIIFVAKGRLTRAHSAHRWCDTRSRSNWPTGLPNIHPVPKRCQWSCGDLAKVSGSYLQSTAREVTSPRTSAKTPNSVPSSNDRALRCPLIELWNPWVIEKRYFTSSAHQKFVQIPIGVKFGHQWTIVGFLWQHHLYSFGGLCYS